MGNSQVKIIVVVFLVIILGLYFYSNYQEKPKHSWSLDLRNNSKNPYASKVLFELLKKYHPKDNFYELNQSDTYDSTEWWQDRKGNYIFIGNDYYYDESSLDNILDFVKEGNCAFFISEYGLPSELLDEIFRDTNYPILLNYPDSSVKVNFFTSNLTFSKDIDYIFNPGPYPGFKYDWIYFQDTLFNQQNVTLLGYVKVENKQQINFLEITYGSGVIYFHTQPILFTNYFMLDENKKQYAERVFSYVKSGEIIWDEKYKYFDYAGKNKKFERSILEYLLKEKSLRWSWFILLVMGLIFLLFGTRRMQRVIPVIHPKENTSLAFIKTLAKLHLQNNDYHFIVEQKMRNLNVFVQKKYGIFLPILHENSEGLKRLSVKSGVSFEVMNDIFKKYQILRGLPAIQKHNPQWIQFNQLIQTFYKTCK